MPERTLSFNHCNVAITYRGIKLSELNSNPKPYSIALFMLIPGRQTHLHKDMYIYT